MTSTALSSHPWAGPDDLRAMQSIVSAAWAGPGRPLVHCTIGDLEWWIVNGGPEVDWSSRIRVWSIGGETVGWGWLSPPASLDWFVRHGLPEHEETLVRRAILDWQADMARVAVAPTDVARADATASGSPVLEAWAADGWRESAELVELGWTPSDTVLTQYVQPLDIELDPPRVPDGYVLRSLRGPADIPARVEVHRAAFAPSRMTVEKYAILLAQDHYAFDRDIVLESADGTFAAFAMCWMDPTGSIGEFEPVGTHPDHQRRGLGRVIMRHGLRLMRAAGLRDALVFSLRSNGASEALYRSAGFDEIAIHRRYTKPLPDGSAAPARAIPARPGSVRRPPPAYNRPVTTEPAGATRVERDSMGEMEVPADALYGASTQRAVLNFPISGQRFPRPFIRALALVKQAAAETNAELGLLSGEIAGAIAAGAGEVAAGAHDDQFPIDIYQTGSGTSTNTNMNEVVAHLAGARLAAAGVAAKVHPNDHVNKCQSSNDVIPTALQVSAAMTIEEALLPALESLRAALDAQAGALWPIVKTGRTHLQDATPIRLGQEFRGYAGQVEESIRRARAAQAELLAVPLGGTAVGTGINAHPDYAAAACRRLSTLTGLDVRETSNHFHAQASLDAAIAAHGALRTIALSLWKVGSDVRLMAMGPRAGLAEIALPETQPGSSIMPGKVNPVIVESLTMVVARVLGNDTTVAFGQTGSFLELNVMLPVTALALLESIALLAAAARNFADRAVSGLTATERGPALVEQGLMLATALAPEIGYDAAAALAKEALRTGRTIRELATERGIAAGRLDELLDPASMTEPGLGAAGGG